MFVHKAERDVGKPNHAKSPAKSLIYQTNSLPPDFVKKKNYHHSIPFATYEDEDVEGKYPSTFVLRKKANGCPTKIGTNRDFDPEVYRQQIRSYQVSKIEAPRKAYVGAGNILCHEEGSAERPVSSGVPRPMSAASVGAATTCTHGNGSGFAGDAATEVPEAD